MSSRRALGWVIFWVLTALGFAWGVFRWSGYQHGMEFLTCYAIEWSLSVDNLFVFLMIFNAFGVEPHRQVRVLSWGIAGAVVMRLGFILLGVTLVNLFEPILYVFGALLIYSAWRMAAQKEGKKDVKNNAFVRFVRKHLPVTKNFVGDKFWIRKRGAFIATPMLLVLVTIESSDIMFAIDSVPAAFAITREPWIIFTANLFAILGLRSLYFLLARADRAFWLLRYGVSFVLVFVGFKMLVMHWVHIPASLSLGLVLGTLVLAILLSLAIKKPVGQVSQGGAGD